LSLPFPVRGAVSFENQAQFDPSKYLIGLAASLSDDGCQVFEQSRVTKLEHGAPCRVETADGAVVAQDVVIATHLPIVGAGKFSLKAQPYAHPMVAAPIDEARAPIGMYLGIDGSPSHSFRTVRSEGTFYLVAVGGEHRPGDTDAATRMFDDLEQFVRSQLGVVSIVYRWSNEDYNSADGIPFVGSADADNPHFKVATGFGAWGITNGTAAGMILADQLLGRANPWASAFDSLRTPNPSDRPAAIKEKTGMVATLLSGVLSRRLDVVDLERGGGMITEFDGRKLAMHRDESGTLHAVSAKCTHMGCTVGWNPVDRTWDCGCHGSRFTAEGEVLHGPATSRLAKEKTPTT
jgi:nitrite reductase/ring-hydroxylating ferredoxin subunit